MSERARATTSRYKRPSCIASGRRADRSAAARSQHVMVGDASKITLPRFRAAYPRLGAGRFSRPPPGPHAPPQRAAHARRHDRPRAAPPRRGGGDRRCRRSRVAPAKLYIGHMVPNGPAIELPPRASDRIEDELSRADHASFRTAVRSRAHRVASTDDSARIPRVAGPRRARPHQRLRGADRRAARAVSHRRRSRCSTCLSSAGPSPIRKFLVGRGKLDEILLRAMQLGADRS